MPLVDALARTTDRQQQRQIAADYWRLAIAQAQLHYAHSNLEHLRAWIQPGHKHSTLVESQLATAEAAIEDAEFRLINDGEALATLVGWPDKDLIPATVDRPHVGDYRTEFERLFSGQTPPPRLRLIHRTMPISRRAIDVHGAALVAAIDALEVTEEDYHQQKTDYLTLAAAFDHLIAEQTAFLASVLRYNEDIAEYAFFRGCYGRRRRSVSGQDSSSNGQRCPPANRAPEPAASRNRREATEQPTAGRTNRSIPTRPGRESANPRTFRQTDAQRSMTTQARRIRRRPSTGWRQKRKLWLVARETPAEPERAWRLVPRPGRIGAGDAGTRTDWDFALGS